MQIGKLDPNKEIAATLHQLGIDATAPKVEILKRLCNILASVHYVAAINELPLDDAYSALLVAGSAFEKEPGIDNVVRVYNAFVAGKIKPAASPIHAVFERIDEVKRELLEANTDLK